MHPSNLALERLLEECDLRPIRGSGPGGQHRNKVSSGISIVHRPTGVTAQATERRDQSVNRSIAISRLRVRLAIQVRSIVDSQTELALSKLGATYGGGRLRIAESNEDYARCLALILDVLCANQGQLDIVSGYLETTVSQVMRLIRQEPEALETVNRVRLSAGLGRLS
jgi:hypothetical protein